MKKKLLLLLKIALSVSIIASLGYYIFDLAFSHSSPFKHIVLPIVFAILPALLLVKLFIDDYKRAINSAEQKLFKETQGAFDTDAKCRRKLLFATYLFIKGKHKRSIKILESIKPKCEKTLDYRATYLFLALNYSAINKEAHAITIYESAIKNGYATSAFYSNLGHLYSRLQNDRKAHENYDQAIYLDPTNITAYHNKAQLCFKEGDYKESINLLTKALELNPKFAPSTTLLAIIYALYGTSEEAIAAKGKAIENGEASASIDRAVNYYRKNLQ